MRPDDPQPESLDALPPIPADDEGPQLDAVLDPPDSSTEEPLLSDEKADAAARNDEFDDLDSKPLDFDDAPPLRRS